VVAAACDAHPDCQAVEFSPLGRDTGNTSVGTLKGSPGRSAPLDLSRSNWTPRAYLLVRQGVQLLPAAAAVWGGAGAGAGEPRGGAEAGSSKAGPVSAAPALGHVPPEQLPPHPHPQLQDSSSGAGLSSGAIAGIALGAAFAVLVASIHAAAIMVRRRRRRRDMERLSMVVLPALDRVRTSGSMDRTALAQSGSSGGAAEVVAVVHSPMAAPLSTPRRRGGQAGPGELAAVVAQDVEAGAVGLAAEGSSSGKEAAQNADSGSSSTSRGKGDCTGGSRACGRSGGSTTPESEQQEPQAAAEHPALSWALEALREGVPQWEDVLLQESDIAFLPGVDGKPISLGKLLLPACCFLLAVLRLPCCS
jgi:hypothetical protein